MGALDGCLLVLEGVHQGGEFVEGEDDVGAEPMLDADRDLGREPVCRAVEVAPEGDAVLVHLGQPVLAGCDDVVDRCGVRVHREGLLETGAEAQHLEAARVGERRARPGHEGAKPAGLGDELVAGLEVQVVRVAENGLGADAAQGVRRDGLDRRAGANRNERGRLDVSVRRAQARRRGRDLPAPQCRTRG